MFLHPSSANVLCGKYESPWLVFSERVETNRVYIRDNTMVGAYALLLFGGEIEVDYDNGTVAMDGGFATFNAPARIGVLVREMRGAVDRLLERHIDQPTEHDGKYFPLTTFLRLVAHTRLTFIFTLRREFAERLARRESGAGASRHGRVLKHCYLKQLQVFESETENGGTRGWRRTVTKYVLPLDDMSSDNNVKRGFQYPQIGSGFHPARVSAGTSSPELAARRAASGFPCPFASPGSPVAPEPSPSFSPVVT